MELKMIGDEFCVCQIKDIADVNFDDEFVFLSKTDDELSLVCRKEFVPENAINVSYGFTAMRFEGVLDFSLIGILSKIAAILAEEKISIFAISTYNTDYVLISTEKKEAAVKALKENGYSIK